MFWRPPDSAHPAAVKTHHAGDVRAAQGKFQHRRAAETITDGRDAFRVHQFILLQRVETGVDAARKSCRSDLYLPRARRLRSRLSDGCLAVNVRAKRDVAELRQHLGAMLLVIRQASH